MPIVHITLTDVWTPEQARGISDAIHEALLAALHELPMENWGIRGLPADQVDLGFETRV